MWEEEVQRIETEEFNACVKNDLIYKEVSVEITVDEMNGLFSHYLLKIRGDPSPGSSTKGRWFNCIHLII